MGFAGSASGKEPACQCRRHKAAGLVPGLGRSPGGRHGNPLQYSCQENPMDGLQSIGLQKAGCDRSDLAQTQVLARFPCSSA